MAGFLKSGLSNHGWLFTLPRHRCNSLGVVSADSWQFFLWEDYCILQNLWERDHCQKNMRSSLFLSLIHLPGLGTRYHHEQTHADEDVDDSEIRRAIFILTVSKCYCLCRFCYKVLNGLVVRGWGVCNCRDTMFIRATWRCHCFWELWQSPVLECRYE